MSGGSCGPPVLWLSANAFQFFRRLRRALFRSSFPLLRCFRSFSVPQSFPYLFRSSVPFLRLFRTSFVPLFRSSDFSVPISFLFSVLLSARHVLDGGVFRQQGNFGFSKLLGSNKVGVPDVFDLPFWKVSEV